LAYAGLPDDDCHQQSFLQVGGANCYQKKRHHQEIVQTMATLYPCHYRLKHENPTMHPHVPYNSQTHYAELLIVGSHRAGSVSFFQFELVSKLKLRWSARAEKKWIAVFAKSTWSSSTFLE
jgi:hypothetical protein